MLTQTNVMGLEAGRGGAQGRQYLMAKILATWQGDREGGPKK